MITATAYRIVPHQNTFELQLPGRVQTSCYGSGTLNWSVCCSSVVTPPSDIPINISWVEVYQEVITGGSVYTWVLVNAQDETQLAVRLGLPIRLLKGDI